MRDKSGERNGILVERGLPIARGAIELGKIALVAEKGDKIGNQRQRIGVADSVGVDAFVVGDAETAVIGGRGDTFLGNNNWVGPWRFGGATDFLFNHGVDCVMGIDLISGNEFANSGMKGARVRLKSDCVRLKIGGAVIERGESGNPLTNEGRNDSAFLGVKSGAKGGSRRVGSGGQIFKGRNFEIIDFIVGEVDEAHNGIKRKAVAMNIENAEENGTLGNRRIAEVKTKGLKRRLSGELKRDIDAAINDESGGAKAIVAKGATRFGFETILLSHGF